MPPEWVSRQIQRPEGVDVALAIDQQLYPAILPLVQRYAAANRLKVAMIEGTCGVAAGALADKSADITGMCCPPGSLDRMPGVRYHTLGIASLALIVHPRNPVTDIRLDQARALFGGQFRSWADLPSSGFATRAGAEVEAVGRLHCKSRPGHWRLLLDDESLFSPDMVEVPAIKDMIIEVARSPTAIGYETTWFIAHHARDGRVKPVRLNGIDPRDAASLARGAYPLYRVFGITSWQGRDANPKAAALVAWLVAHADEMAPEYGIIPVSALRRQGWRFDRDELVGEPG